MYLTILFLLTGLQNQTAPTPKGTVPGTYPPVPKKYWVATRRVTVKTNPAPSKAGNPKSSDNNDGTDILTESGILRWGTDSGPQNSKSPSFHKVKAGETLWDIARRYFGDPWYWPSLWALNPHITNPHWLFPGTIVILRKNAKIKQSSGPDDKTYDMSELSVSSGMISFRRRAFIEEKDYNKAAVITGSPSEKTMLSTGDAVYIKYDKRKPVPGEILSVYEPWKVLVKTKTKGSGKNKKTEKYNDGRVVKILGAVRIVELRPKKYAKAIIISAQNIIKRKHFVGPVSYNFTNITPHYIRPEKYTTGKILYSFKEHELLSDGDMVIVNLGYHHGVKKGTVLKILEKGDGMEENLHPLDPGKNSAGSSYPYETKGKIIIVHPKKYYSVAIIYKASKIIDLGDKIVFGDYPDLKNAKPSESETEKNSEKDSKNKNNEKADSEKAPL